MAKYLCTADAVGYLKIIVEAKDEDEAWNEFEHLLEDGAVPEDGNGSIENKQVELADSNIPTSG